MYINNRFQNVNFDLQYLLSFQCNISVAKLAHSLFVYEGRIPDTYKVNVYIEI